MVSTTRYNSVLISPYANKSCIVDPEESDGLLVKDGVNRPNQTQSRSKKRRLARLEEYDEDTGRAGSRGFQRWAKVFETCTSGEAARSKAFLKEFSKEVKKKEVELKTFRQMKEQEFTKGQEKFATVFKQLYSTATSTQQLPDGQNQRLGALRKEDHPLFKQAQTNTGGHLLLMTQFKLVEEQLNANKLELPVDRWKQDKRDIKELLACSGSYGEALVESVLAPKSAPCPVIDQPGTSENEQIAKELFKDSRKVLDEETWGHVAEEQVKKFSAIAQSC
ncbi:hypothetical protein HD806DRAFT_484238 [Xylariaceae sp. AK1471]|nr:hypothetical protein HD806DRAFT_484238 [Xylariaceae sp. AK1471]